MSPRVFVPRLEIEQARNPVQISALLDDFQRLAQVSHLFNENPVSRVGEPEMQDYTTSIGEIIIGRSVVIYTLSSVTNSNIEPIQSFWKEGKQPLYDALYLRDGERRLNPHNNLVYKKKASDSFETEVTGKIEAVDGLTASFVLKQTGFNSHSNERFWARPVALDGAKLLDLKFK